MTKFWRVAWHEYRHHVLNKRFLIAILSVPLVVALMVGIIFLMIKMETDYRPVGYVDFAGLLTDPLPAPIEDELEKRLEMRSYASEEAAQADLESGVIQAFYLIPADYHQTNQMTLVMRGKMGNNASQQFFNFVQVNLLANLPSEVATRVVENPEIVYRSLDGNREYTSYSWINMLLGIVIAVVFMLITFTTSGYLLNAIVEEKENRTIEVLVTSISPTQLMGGKVTGIIGVGSTQFLAWLAFIVVGTWVLRDQLSFLNEVTKIDLRLSTWLELAIILLPAYVMVCALLATIGATVAEASEGQQVSALVSLPMMVPVWFLFLLINNPNSPLALALTFFPLTAPMTLSFRLLLTDVPGWQLGLAIGVLVLSATGALWIAGRAFRIGMLRYGQRVRLAEILARSKKP
jgi:ABC-2 type transport system permease protein